MRKSTKLVLCTMAAVVLASGCGKKAAEETTAAETTTAAEVTVPEATVTLGDYKGLEITEPDASVTDDQVQQQIDSNLSSNPEETEVTDRAIQDGDTVNIDFVGMKDGVPFDGGTSPEGGYDLVIGSKSFIDGFEEGLIGANKGDELSLNLTFPADYYKAELAGADVVFDVTVNSIKEKKDAVLDDAFVQRVSETAKTVDEYRQEIRTSLEDTAKQNAEMEKQNAVMDAAITNATFEGLDAQVQAEYDNQIAQMTQMLEQNNSTLADYATMYGMDEAGFQDYLRSSIESNIQVGLVSKAIAEAEKLTVDDKAYSDLAALYQLDDVSQLVSSYGQDAVDEAARNVMVMNYLVENAKVTQ